METVKWPTMELAKYLTPRLTKYIPHAPTDPQCAFLLLDCKEALYGGSAGGGKTDCLLMAALQYVDVPGYAAMIFRKTYQDLALPNGLIPRSHEWLATTDASWDGTSKAWKFPSGATMSFGYMDSELDHFRYQGSEVQFIGWDELTQFAEMKYTYMFSRLRGLTGNPVPLRVRSTSNPGGVGHVWVKRRFIDLSTKDLSSIFIPARLSDNPHIRQSEYINSLSYLDPVTRARYLDGDWTITEAGAMFRREWFEIVDQPPINLLKVCAWDLAATEPDKGKDPDYTAGCIMGKDAAGIYYVLDMIRVRKTPADVEAIVKQTAQVVGKNCWYFMEQEPGSSGVNTIDHYKRTVLPGFYFDGEKATGTKSDRARPFSSMAQGKNVKLVAGRWNADFLNEIEAFPNVEHDDQVDAASLAFEKLATRQWDSGWNGRDGKLSTEIYRDLDNLPRDAYSDFRPSNPGFENIFPRR